jgi:hypothetical protein
MNCAECKEILVAYVEGLLAEPQKQAVESHLKDCPPCRAELAELIALRNRLTANGKHLAQSDLENKVLNRIVREQNLKLRKVSKQIQLWRIIMKSRITKLATAAAIIIIAALSITFLDKSVTPAYALEQTIVANHTVRYLHIRFTDALHDEAKEFWVECDEFGQIKNARMHMPEWDSPLDGAKVGIWKQNKVEIYFKKKNMLFVARDKTVADHMLKLVEENDPRLAVKRLQEKQVQGKIKIEIDEPSDKAEPVVVTATYLPESSKPNQRLVLFVDQATKLVTAIEFYSLKNGEYQYTGAQEYYDYNQPIEAKMFTLDETLIPDDAMRVDQTTQEVGLVQGQLSDEEVAVEVVRQFFEALIAKDYAKAGKLMEGIPADRMKQGFGKVKFLRIVLIDQPAPHPIPATKGVIVPCTVEIEKDGEISEWKLERLGVREVYNQPGRWTIFGGI